jgi:hypothetical protein
MNARLSIKWTPNFLARVSFIHDISFADFDLVAAPAKVGEEIAQQKANAMKIRAA